MLRALIIVLLALAAAAPAAAAPLRTIDRGPFVGPANDGKRLIASPTPQFDGVTLYDIATGSRATIAAPPNCTFGAISRRDELLWSCGESRGITGQIHDPATGTRTSLPFVPYTLAEGLSYAGLGDSWARVHAVGYHFAFDAYVNRASGELVKPADRDRRRRFDMDSATLSRPLCRGFERPMVPADAGAGIGLELGALAIAGRRAAATTHTDTEDGPNGTVVLQRCGHRQQALARCDQPSYCSQPVIGARIVAWTRTRRPYTRLYVRSLRTARTRSLRIGGPATPFLVGGRLFIGTGGRLVEVLSGLSSGAR